MDIVILGQSFFVLDSRQVIADSYVNLDFSYVNLDNSYVVLVFSYVTPVFPTSLKNSTPMTISYTNLCKFMVD